MFDDIENGLIPVGIFYDLSKAFDSVNHSVLIRKLESIGVEGENLNWFVSYLSSRPWYFLLNSIDKKVKINSDTNIRVGVPQGSVLGPLLFLIYINDLFDVFPDSIRPTGFADDVEGSFGAKNKDEIVPTVTECNARVKNWSVKNGCQVNDDKLVYLVFHKNVPGNVNLEFSTEAKLLGVTVDSNLSFISHVDSVASKICSSIYCLISVRKWAGKHLLLNMYYALIQSHLSYGILSWGNNIAKFRVDRLLRLQKWALRVINKKDRRYSCRELFASDKILTFPCLVIYHSLLHTHNKLSGSCHIRSSDIHNYNLRNSKNLYVEFCRTKRAQNFVSTSGRIFFNCLPYELKMCDNFRLFKSGVRKLLLDNPCYSFEEFFDRIGNVGRS